MAAEKLKTLCLIGTGVIATVGFFKAYKPSYEIGRYLTEPIEKPNIKLTSKERHFVRFASIEYAGQVYMTPQDFLQSVLEPNVETCLRRRILTTDDVISFKSVVPPVAQNTSTFFRKLSHKGIISFTEYLFLISVLTKPEIGFRIAFNMFDTDGNQRVNRDEFLMIRNILGQSFSKRETDDDTRRALRKLEPHRILTKTGSNETKDVVTTLQVHFFGQNGQYSLRYADFKQFMQNLQREILQIEFERCSKGNERISEADFARILLRKTRLEPQRYSGFLQRLDNLDKHEGVTFAEFENFCQVLHNLKDIDVATRLFRLAWESMSRREFSQIVKICCGSVLNDHLVDIVFVLFDEDQDGLISYDDFLLVMKNKVRLFQDRRSVGWKAFKRCYRQETKGG